MNNSRNFERDAVIVKMNFVAYSGRNDRGSHIPVLCDLSGVVGIKLQVIFDVADVHFVAVSHRFEAK